MNYKDIGKNSTRTLKKWLKDWQDYMQDDGACYGVSDLILEQLVIKELNRRNKNE